MKKYAIVCGSRTGSTYLCDLLKSTNRCGLPEEFYNKDMGFPQDKHKWIKKYTSANDVFGVKIVGLNQLKAFFDSELKIDYYLWLYREDSVLQAISRYIAFSTNGWHKQKPLPEYSYDGIKWCLDEIESENIYFEDFFEDKNYLKLNYEIDLCQNPEQTIVASLSFMDINVEELPRIKSVRKLTHEVNQQWKNRFNEENRNQS